MSGMLCKTCGQTVSKLMPHHCPGLQPVQPVAKPEHRPRGVLAPFISTLRLQQQSVIILALRGPDGDPKHTPFKHLLRAYRGTVLMAAKYGRMLEWGERADSFMSLDEIAVDTLWDMRVKTFLEDQADGSVLHHYTHFMHGAQILGYKHPDERFARAWSWTYLQFVNRLHLNPESEEQMDARLCDWGQKHWEDDAA